MGGGASVDKDFREFENNIDGASKKLKEVLLNMFYPISCDARVHSVFIHFRFINK